MNDKPPVDEIFNQNANPRNTVRTIPGDVKWVARPATKKRLDELHKLLSRPRLACELTPMGPVTRQVRREEDRMILSEAAEVRQQLEARRNAAKEAFQRAVENKTHRRGPRR